MNSISYSWVLPVRNEARSLPQLVREIREVMGDKRYEIIMVDDASIDGAKVQIAKVQWLRCKEHVGKWEALRLGLLKARNAIIITIDSDLQDNPKDVNRLLEKLEEGYDAVGGWRQGRKDPGFMILVAKWGSALLGFKDLNTSYKVFRKELVKYLPVRGSHFRFLLWLWRKKGFGVTEVPVVRRKRIYGRSHYGMAKYGEILYDLGEIWVKQIMK